MPISRTLRSQQSYSSTSTMDASCIVVLLLVVAGASAIPVTQVEQMEAQRNVETTDYAAPPPEKQDPKTVRTLFEYPYDDDIHMGDPHMFLPNHPCYYKMCRKNTVCIVREGFRRGGLSRACKPHCLSSDRLVGRRHTTRECIYVAHPNVFGVLELKCNCRTHCDTDLHRTPVCGSDGHSYPSYCILQQTNCEQKKAVTVTSLGSCPESTENDLLRACTPTLAITSENSAHTDTLAAYEKRPIQYRWGFLMFVCKTSRCPGASPPKLFRQEIQSGQPSERTAYKSRSMEYSKPGRLFGMIFPTQTTDSGLYTCEVMVNGTVLRSPQRVHVMVQEPPTATIRIALEKKFSDRLRPFRG